MTTRYINGDVSAYCPDCGVHTTFEHKIEGRELETLIINRKHMYLRIEYSRILYRLLRCASCRRGGLAVIHDNGQVYAGVLGAFFPISIEHIKLPPETPDGT